MNDANDSVAKTPALFSQNQKELMAAKISGLTEEPDVVVNQIEQALCEQAAETVREVAALLSDRIANAIGRWISGK